MRDVIENVVTFLVVFFSAVGVGATYEMVRRATVRGRLNHYRRRFMKRDNPSKLMITAALALIAHQGRNNVGGITMVAVNVDSASLKLDGATSRIDGDIMKVNSARDWADLAQIVQRRADRERATDPNRNR